MKSRRNIYKLKKLRGTFEIIDKEALLKELSEKRSEIRYATEEPLTIVKSIGLGIVIGIGLLLLNLSLVYIYMFSINNYLYRLHISQSIGSIVMLLYVSIMIGFFPFSYYYAGKYCGKHWKKPSWEWGFWLTLPIIGFTVKWYMDVFINPRYSNVSLAGNFILIALIITYFVLLLVSSYGGYVGAKSVQQEEEISE